jgi:hypothetical protein
MTQVSRLSRPCPRCGGADRFFLVQRPRNGGVPFWLCRRCNHTESATDQEATPVPQRILSPEEVEQVYAAYTTFAAWSADYLWSNQPDARQALDYLRRRGFRDQTIKAAGLGFHPQRQEDGAGLVLWRSQPELWHAAQLGGLLGPQGKLKRILRGTLTLPYLHQRRVGMLRGRAMEGGYFAPSGLHLFAGGQPTFFLHDQLEQHETILLCEGEFKALAAMQAGLGAVAQPGVNYFPEAYLHALAGKTVVVAYDVEQRHDPFELSPGEHASLTRVGTLCGLRQQAQIEQLYDAIGELEKRKSGDDLHEQTRSSLQVQAAKSEIARLKAELHALAKLNIRVKVLRLPRRADQTKVDLDGWLISHSADVLHDLVERAPWGKDWYHIHSGGEFGYTRTGMHNGKPCANYKARIVETVFQHDGMQTTTLQRIALQTPSGRRLSVDIPDEDWADDRRAVKIVRKSLQEGTFDDKPSDALRAIRLLSNHGDPPVGRWVNTCTGWEKLEGKWHFLAPDGAIHATGINHSIRAEIDPDASGNHYQMCGPGDPRQGAAAYLNLLRGGVIPQPLALLLAGQTALSVLHRFNGNAARSMLWVHHETGSLKTATIRACVMALFGPNFTAERGDGAPVIKWDASSVGLSLASFLYRDLPLIIDDYKAGMIAPDQFRRYIHAYSEGTSRTRATKELGLEKARPVRVMAFSTAEDIPQGDPGIQARLLSVVLKPETVDTDALALLQRDGAAGHLAAFWRDFLSAIAGQLDARGPGYIEERMQALVRKDEADLALSGHRRTAGALRQNRAAWLVLSTWLEQAGYITADEARSLNLAHLSARMLLTADMNALQRSSRPSQIFLGIMTELISNGELIIEHPGMTCSRCDGDLKRANDGWFCTSDGCSYHIPAQRVVGFRYGKGVALFSNKAFQHVCRVRNDQRQPFNYSQTAIWQQLEADGALLERGQDRPQVRKRNAANPGPDGKGKPESVLLVRAEALETQGDPDEEPQDNLTIMQKPTQHAQNACDPCDPCDPVIGTRKNGPHACDPDVIPCDPCDPNPDDLDFGITRITSGSHACDPKIPASESHETSWDHKDHKNSEDQCDQKEFLHYRQVEPSAPIPVRHPVHTIRWWRKRLRELLATKGTAKECALDLDKLTVEEMEQLCERIERRAQR